VVWSPTSISLVDVTPVPRDLNEIYLICLAGLLIDILSQQKHIPRMKIVYTLRPNGYVPLSISRTGP
jgi:hypothetical protein